MSEKKLKTKIDPEKCKACLLCVGVCPQKILAPSNGVNKKGTAYVIIVDPDKCTSCGLCAIMCPDLAIEIK